MLLNSIDSMLNFLITHQSTVSLSVNVNELFWDTLRSFIFVNCWLFRVLSVPVKNVRIDLVRQSVSCIERRQKRKMLLNSIDSMLNFLRTHQSTVSLSVNVNELFWDTLRSFIFVNCWLFRVLSVPKMSCQHNCQECKNWSCSSICFMYCLFRMFTLVLFESPVVVIYITMFSQYSCLCLRYIQVKHLIHVSKLMC